MRTTPRVRWLGLNRFWDQLCAGYVYQVAAACDHLTDWLPPESGRRRGQRRPIVPEFELLEIRWLPSGGFGSKPTPVGLDLPAEEPDAGVRDAAALPKVKTFVAAPSEAAS